MGNENSTPAAVGNALTTDSDLNASRKFSLPTEIFFEILAFVKFYEAPNIFLVNRYLLPICQVYFHSGTVGQNKYRNVRDLTMELKKGSLTILVERNGTWQSMPVPEMDPPKLFNAFGKIKVKKCCQIQAMQFLNKFQSLLNKEKNEIICARDFFGNISDESQIQINSNSLSSVVVDEKQLFLNWIEQKKLLLGLKPDYFSEGIARCLADEPLISQFNGCLCIKFKNERNLCGQEEDAKLIYGWISSAGTRMLGIRHYDVQRAQELAYQIVLLFEQAHINQIEAKKMNLTILLPEGTVVPMYEQKIYNGIGDHLATLRTFFAKANDGYKTSAYKFYTKSIGYYYEKYYYENKEELELFIRQVIYFE